MVDTKDGEVGMTLRQIAEKYGLTSDGVDFALSQYQIVISEITHGMMSKLSYYAKDIIQVAQERWCDTCDLKAVSGWISVKDRLPEKSGTYLCYQPKAADICCLNTVRWSTQLGWMGKEVGSRIEGIEYWMPLPEPPKEEEHG
jgi:hypothetical protein